MPEAHTILIVDDNPLGCEALSDLLEPENYNLIFASDGPDALRKATSLRPDIILLDVMMPGMDGYEVCRRLRASEDLAEAPVLMVTALDDRASRLRGIEAGADAFISKPFDRRELRARVKNVMRLNRYRKLRDEHDMLEQAYSDLRATHEATLTGWVKALDLRDKETEGHTQRVVALTMRLADAVGMKDDNLIHICRGALLHDIGKLGVPDHILLKPGKLTGEEWSIMQRHPAYAYEWLSVVPYLSMTVDIPYCHHEKWDGTGYPRGLKGKEITLGSRLFPLVDVYDALCSDRPYRQAWSNEQTLDHIKAASGTHFDPEIVAVFLEMMSPVT